METESYEESGIRSRKKRFLFLIAVLVLGAGVFLLLRSAIFTKESQLPICSVDTKEKKLSLSFEVTNGNEDLKKILEILKKYQIQATFFVAGRWADAYPEDVKAIVAAGHDLGNHSESYKNMTGLSPEQCKEELMALHEKIKKLTGQEMNLFRAPFGEYDDTLIETVHTCGYHVIQWNIDSIDWKDYGTDAILKQVLEHPELGAGAIVRMHSDTKFTAKALEAVIAGLKEKGYTIVPVSELIDQNNDKVNSKGRQKKEA